MGGRKKEKWNDWIHLSNTESDTEIEGLSIDYCCYWFAGPRARPAHEDTVLFHQGLSQAHEVESMPRIDGNHRREDAQCLPLPYRLTCEKGKLGRVSCRHLEQKTGGFVEGLSEVERVVERPQCGWGWQTLGTSCSMRWKWGCVAVVLRLCSRLSDPGLSLDCKSWDNAASSRSPSRLLINSWIEVTIY